MRQAVIIIHGSGEQRPMRTLRACVAGALGVDSTTLNQFVFSKPDRVSDILELRRLSAVANDKIQTSTLCKGSDTDFYELYWQHLMQGTKWSSVWSWALRLLQPGRTNPRFSKIQERVIAWVVFTTLMISAVVVELQHWMQESPFWHSTGTGKVFSVSRVCPAFS